MLFAIAIFLQILAMLFLAILVAFVGKEFEGQSSRQISAWDHAKTKEFVIHMILWAALWGTTWIVSIILFWMS